MGCSAAYQGSVPRWAACSVQQRRTSLCNPGIIRSQSKEAHMAQPSLWGNALQDAFANPMTLGGLSLLSGGDLNSGIRSGAALQQQVQQQRQRDATQESLKGMFADPNSQFSKLDSSRSLLESNRRHSRRRVHEASIAADGPDGGIGRSITSARRSISCGAKLRRQETMSMATMVRFSRK